MLRPTLWAAWPAPLAPTHLVGVAYVEWDPWTSPRVISPTQVGAQPHGPPPRCAVVAFDHHVCEPVPSSAHFIAACIGCSAGASHDAYVCASHRAHVPSHGASSYRATRGFALELCGRRWPLGRWLALHGRVAWLE